MGIRSLSRWMAGVGVALGLTLGAPVAAGAAAGPGLQAVKDVAKLAIDTRLGALHTAIAAVGSSPFMGADKAVLVDGMQQDITGLTQLATAIEGDTTVAAQPADAAKVFTDYRVFALVLPVAHMVRASDAITTQIVPALTKVADDLQAVIDRKGATAQQATLDDMKAQIAAAQQAVAGLPAQLEAYTPAQWNADHTLLSPDRAALQTARTDLRQARQDARTLVASLVHG